jgi:hypothetical protein
MLIFNKVLKRVYKNESGLEISILPENKNASGIGPLRPVFEAGFHSFPQFVHKVFYPIFAVL